MNKKERKQLVVKAIKDFGRPYIIEANDERGQTRFGLIQSDQDERTFIDFAARGREWYAKDLNLSLKLCRSQLKTGKEVNL